ncbi:hypothetical protein B0T25DRAFT_464942, partial [Lasiosphaeria hispida]
IYLKDGQYENIIIYFPEACDFIEKALAERDKNAGNKDQEARHPQRQPPAVFVHCIIGASRLVTLVLTYLM